jgi:hypothetical protein
VVFVSVRNAARKYRINGEYPASRNVALNAMLKWCGKDPITSTWWKKKNVRNLTIQINN